MDTVTPPPEITAQQAEPEKPAPKPPFRRVVVFAPLSS